ncbi:hypothetical protein [Flavivirga jejuensis]|uniref:Uncharacterized protein n=1 Tax=Flavivirga jejuensis TaxID=870487 RepID=A0ABT8WNE9_9FLAO|nr:hypothetical protein [Flavivirga jejuensis]MDO5974689.1 hypothetical protein [Flavivirga jejuensis]
MKETHGLFSEKLLKIPEQEKHFIGVKSVMTYWFSIAAFYPNPEVYTP